MQRGHAVFIIVGALAAGFASAEPPAGGGPAPHVAHDELSPEQRARIDEELAHNVAVLQQQGILPTAAPMLRPEVGGLQWPLRAAAGYPASGYHGVSNFVDRNAAYPNQLLDYECGTRTYDQSSGYNHAGIDYFLWPFPWRMMDDRSVDIVAAAPGVIIGKNDGFNDRSCPNNYSSDWNAVYVQHADGTVAWYGHMVKNSLTSKPIGASVAVGEFLGKVGSSGFSSGPHLHFENHSAVSNYTVLDPNHGACNAAPSLWAAQRPYHDSAINRLATHSAPPVMPDPNCPNPVAETPNFSDRFMPGNTVYFAGYYRDQKAGQVTNYAVLRPDGTVFSSWTQNPTVAHYSASYWYWQRSLPANAPSGVWTFRATFEGVTTVHRFFVGDVIFADGFE